MATAKPPILSTHFLRAVRSCRPQTHRSIRNPPATKPARASLHSSCRKFQQEQGYQRYGPAAVTAMPPPSKPSAPFLPSTEQTSRDASELDKKKVVRESQANREDKNAQQAESKQLRDEDELEEEEEDIEPVRDEPVPVKAEPVEPEPSKDATEAQPKEPKDKDKDSKEQKLSPLGNPELDMVLSIPSPSEIKGGDKLSSQSSSTHPHLEASPYEHHFDTYTLVQELCKQQAPPPTTTGEVSHEQVIPFSEAQSVTLMKAIRLMLAQNLDLAKEGLVSKSDTENETYLFRAACSELKTTMQTSRFMEAQKQRSQRAQLQHEFDILNQKVSQDIMTMREELKGMFNDRKLGLQEEKRQVDGKIQNLGYRISVDLNSEARSEVEGLRWVLTRRAALAIGAAAFMVLSFLQYYSGKAREQAEIDKKRKAAQKQAEERLRKEEERYGASGATIGRSTGTQTDGIVLGGTAGSGNYEESLG